MRDPILRFGDKVLIGDGCWQWLGAKGKQGHGRFRPGGRAPQVSAYRWIYELLVGPIPAGHEIDHLCRNPSCVNPGHLEPVTASENLRRRIPPPLLAKCRRGHAFDAENTWINPRTGYRYCRSCNAARQRAFQARKSGRKP